MVLSSSRRHWAMRSMVSKPASRLDTIREAPPSPSPSACFMNAATRLGTPPASTSSEVMPSMYPMVPPGPGPNTDPTQLITCVTPAKSCGVRVAGRVMSTPDCITRALSSPPPPPPPLRIRIDESPTEVVLSAPAMNSSSNTSRALSPLRTPATTCLPLASTARTTSRPVRPVAPSTSTASRLGSLDPPTFWLDDLTSGTAEFPTPALPWRARSCCRTVHAPATRSAAARATARGRVKGEEEIVACTCECALMTAVTTAV
mmetsp:Transcript_24013/g.59560  ORF Transcript_24013/g.59560 Transcript_24013/m.59560 type:complete len:260 (-) Transcript_24013:1049-1828(-)